MQTRAAVILVAAMLSLGCLIYAWTHVQRFVDRGRVSRAEADLDALATALKIFRSEHDFYPTTVQGLEILLEPSDDWPTDCLHVSQFDEFLIDPWDSSYDYESDGLTYRLTCWGADGCEGGEGFDADLVRVGAEDTATMPPR